jgi:signal transduction histidine kinase
MERNRANIVSKDDINKLEDKIKDLEDQITHAKKKGEEKQKLDYLEAHLKRTDD